MKRRTDKKAPLIAFFGFVFGAATFWALSIFWLATDADPEAECLVYQEQIDGLNQQVKQLQYDATISQEAIGLIKDENKRYETELTELRNNLRFYKNILEPQQADDGLIIKDLRLKPSSVAGQYVYSITLTQNKDGYPKTAGELAFSIVGARLEAGDTIPSVIEFAELVESGKKSRKFGFRYFEELEGTITLPAGFLPEQINVQVDVKTPSRMSVTKSYPWQDEVVIP